MLWHLVVHKWNLSTYGCGRTLWGGKTKLRPCQFYMWFPGTCANNSVLWKEDKSFFTPPQNCCHVSLRPTLGVLASAREPVGHLSNPLSSCPHLGSHFCIRMLRKRNPMNWNPGKKRPWKHASKWDINVSLSAYIINHSEISGSIFVNRWQRG